MRGRFRKPHIPDEQDVVVLKRHERRLRYLRERRKMRRLEIGLIRFRTFLRLFSIIFLGWLIFKLATLPQWYLNTNIFNSYPASNLSIEGNDIVSTSQIIDKLKTVQLPHKPLYLVNTRLIVKPLLSLVPIEKVYVRRFWFPARLKIVVQERSPVIAVTPSPKARPVAVFTDDIKIIGKEFLPLPSTQKPHTIVTIGDFYKWSSKHVNYLVELSEVLEAISGEHLKYLDIRDPEDVYAQLTNTRVRLGEMDVNLEKRAKRLRAVMSQANNLTNKINYIDLRWENSVAIKLKDKDQGKQSKVKPTKPETKPEQ